MRGGCRAKADIRLTQRFLADSNLLIICSRILADSGLISIIDFHSRVTDSVLTAGLVAECFGTILGVLASVLGFLKLGEARVGVFWQNKRGVV